MSTDAVLPILFRWIHIVAAIVAIGGAAYARIALAPAIAETLDEGTGARLRDAVARRWRMVVYLATALLLASGLYNFMTRMGGDAELPSSYHALFGVKFLLAMVVFFLASALVGRSAALSKIREKGRFWLAAVAVLGLAVAMIGGLLKHLG